jgi:hypothetical protein
VPAHRHRVRPDREARTSVIGGHPLAGGHGTEWTGFRLRAPDSGPRALSGLLA